MNQDIPSPYDHHNGSRTLTEAMRELQAFRATRKPHDLGVLQYPPVFKRNPSAPEPEPVQEAKKPKRKKMLE